MTKTLPRPLHLNALPQGGTPIIVPPRLQKQQQQEELERQRQRQRHQTHHREPSRTHESGSHHIRSVSNGSIPRRQPPVEEEGSSSLAVHRHNRLRSESNPSYTSNSNHPSRHHTRHDINDNDNAYTNSTNKESNHSGYYRAKSSGGNSAGYSQRAGAAGAQLANGQGLRARSNTTDSPFLERMKERDRERYQRERQEREIVARATHEGPCKQHCKKKKTMTDLLLQSDQCHSSLSSLYHVFVVGLNTDSLSNQPMTTTATLAQSTGTALWNRFRTARNVINTTILGEERWPGMCGQHVIFLTTLFPCHLLSSPIRSSAMTIAIVNWAKEKSLP